MNTIIKKAVAFILDWHNRMEWRIYLHDLKKKQFLPQKTFIKLTYWIKNKKRLNLRNPKSFTEKINWIKCYYHNPLYTNLVDKYAVRDYVKAKIGEDYLVPLIGVYNNWDEIDFGSLPQQFVIKCTHDSGGISICKDKKNWEEDKVKTLINHSLANNYYRYSREWPYKNVPPRIIIEKYLKDEEFSGKTSSDLDELLNYKFFCFNGEPKFLYVSYNSVGIGKGEAFLNIYSINWNKVPFNRPDEKELPFDIEKPEAFNEMIDLSKRLSQGLPFVRIDLYYVNSKIYFSEYTFSPTGGFAPFNPPEWEIKIGDMLILPRKYKSK